jgi:hypothetical protein
MSIKIIVKSRGIELSVEHPLNPAGSPLETFDSAVAELRGLLPYSWQADQGFELVNASSASSTSPTDNQVPVNPSARASKGLFPVPCWSDRLNFARECGAASARIIRGERANWPADIGLSLQSTCYVILRTKTGDIPEGGFAIHSRWSDCRESVEDITSGRRHPGDRSVFKGWPSQREVEAYLQGAGIRKA